MSIPTLVSLQICCMLLNDYCISINFIAPESDPNDIDITPSRTSNTSVPSTQSPAASIIPEKPITEKVVSDDHKNHPLSTISPATTTMPDKPVTENEVSDDNENSTQPPGISIGGSPPLGITIAAVLGVIVIVGILLGIAVLGAVLYRRVRKRSRVSTKSAFSLQNTTLIGN